MSGTRRARMEAALTTAFAPILLAVTDESARHAGHAGAAPGGETHFSVEMVSASFAGMRRPDRARAVHAVLAPEWNGGLHALSLSLRTPEEARDAASVRGGCDRD